VGFDQHCKQLMCTLYKNILVKNGVLMRINYEFAFVNPIKGAAVFALRSVSFVVLKI